MSLSHKTDVEDGSKTINGLRRASEVRQWIYTLSANLTILSTGMVLGFPAVSLSQLISPENSSRLDENEASWFASINQVACPLGGLLASYLLDKFGRKRTMNLIAVITVIGWLVLAFTPEEEGQQKRLYYQLLAGRLITGFAGGLSGSPATVYAAEIAHPDIRGRLTVLTTTTIAFGVLLIYFLGFLFQNDWRLIAMIATGICLMAFLTSLSLPESPRWLAMKNRVEEVESSYHKLNGIGRNEKERIEITKEINMIVQECQKQPTEGIQDQSLWQKLQCPNVYKPLSFLIGFFTIQQLCGVFLIIVYIGQFAKSVGVTEDIYTFIVLTGCTRFVGVIISGFSSDEIGRRCLGFTSGIGITISTLAIQMCLLFPFVGSHWCAMIMIIFYVFFGTIGYHTLPFSMMAELFPPDIRGFATGINVFYVNLISFALIKSYPFVLAAVGMEYIFPFISVASLIGVIYIYRFLPETKGKTMKELEELYK